MVAMAQETRKYLMIGYNQRLTKAHAEVRRLILSGEIYDIITFRTTFG